MTDYRIFKPIKEGIILHRQDENPYTNVPRVVVHHSPDGFEWGYGGSGPADLALNILEVILIKRDFHGERTQCYHGSCFTVAWKLHQDFKRQFIAGAPHAGYVLPYALAEAWLLARLEDQLPAGDVRIDEQGGG